MGRPKRDTVDYFFDYVKYTQTMEIIDNKYGNDGKAAWWLLLETLGSTAGHALYKNDIMKWELFVSKTHLQENLVIEILDTFSRLGAIDLDLWKSGIIWSQNFVDGIEGVYVKRKSEKPQKPVTVTETIVTGTETQISVPESAQSIGEYSKVENKIPSVEGGKKIKKLDDGSYCYTIKKMVKNKEKNTNYYFSKFDAGMAKLLSESIIKNYPNHKKEKDDKLAAWANQCRLLRTDEERPLEEVDIERVLRWSQKSTFWYKNICCMEKFRDKYEELDMKSQEIKSYQQQSNPAAINTDEIDYKGELDPENNPKHFIFSANQKED